MMEQGKIHNISDIRYALYVLYSVLLVDKHGGNDDVLGVPAFRER
jgi:hypothetical protein